MERTTAASVNGPDVNGPPTRSTPRRFTILTSVVFRSTRPTANIRRIVTLPGRLPVASQYFRITPTTIPWTWTFSASSMMGAMVRFAGWSRILPPGSR